MHKRSLLQAKITKRSIKYRDRQESRLAGRLNRIFKAWAKELAQKVQQLPQLQPKSFIYIETKQLDADIQELLDGSSFKPLMTEALIAYIGASYVKGSRDLNRALRDSGVSFSFNLDSPEVIRILEARRIFELSNYNGNITDTTRKKIVQIVSGGIENGLSIGEIAHQITLEGQAGVFSKSRAEFIATQEIGRAYGQAQFDTAQEIGAMTGRAIEKAWITAEDDKVRPTHSQNADDGWIDLNANFSGTGEKAAPSQDFRCRCTFETRLKP